MFTNMSSWDPIQLVGSLKFIHLGEIVLLREKEKKYKITNTKLGVNINTNLE